MKKGLLLFAALYLCAISGFCQLIQTPGQIGGYSPLTEFKGVYFASATKGWAVGEFGTITTTNDGGVTWTPQISGTGKSLTSSYFVSPTEGWAVGAFGIILYTNDGGTTWVEQPSGTNKSLQKVQFVSPTKGWAVGISGTILTTDNGGASWTSQTYTAIQYEQLNCLSMASSTTGYIGTNSGTILKTNDGGASWTSVATIMNQNYDPEDGPGPASVWGISFTSDTKGWAVGDNGTIATTNNGGTSWTYQTSNTNSSLMDINFISTPGG